MTTVTDTQPIAAVAERYFAAWEACDPARIAELHTPQTTFHIHAGSDPVVGREAVRKAFASIFEAWPGFRFETDRVFYGDRHWVLDWTLISGDGAGESRIDCLDVVELSPDGLVSRKDTYIDATALAAGAEGEGAGR